MRIAHVVHNFPPEFTGGTERFVEAVARAQREAGAEVFVVAGSDRPHQGVDLELEEWCGLEVLRLKRTPAEAYHVDFVRERSSAVLRRLWAERRPEVVHVHHWQTLPFDTARGAAESGASVFASLHDFFAVCPRMFRIPPDPAIRCPVGRERESCIACVRAEAGGSDEELAARFARRDAWVAAELAAVDEALAPSWTHARRLQELLGPEAPPLGVVEPGVPEEWHRSALEPESEPEHEGPLRIVTWGNQVWVKGLLVLLDALALLPVPEVVELDVWGPFGDADLERAARARIEEVGAVVRLHGAFGGGLSRLAEITARHHLAVFPSLAYESYGLVVDEALALGLPVLVSDQGALGERCGDAGMCLPAGDAEAWSRMLRRLSVDRELLAAMRSAIPGRMPSARDAARDLLARYERARSARAEGGRS